MSQGVKYVDLSRGYIPMDPNSFPDGLQVVDQKEDTRIPVMPYDGRNFLPTAYGYRSFFGSSVTLGIDDLEERADWILLFQNEARNNFLIALCDSGIWYKAGSTAGAWVQAIVLPDNRENPLVHYEWTYAVLNNKLYCYRENGANYYTIESEVAPPGLSVNTKTPTFLNMIAQKGIFVAGNRLGFWDSANSTAWSTLDDKENFTPDLETLAGYATFDQIVGRIVSCKQHGDGFIIYATKSILHIMKSDNSLYMWDSSVVLKETGIAYAEQVAMAIPDTTHFVYTNTGMYKIESGKAEIIVPEVTDFFKTQPQPKYLALMEGRYLFVQVLDPNYVTGYPTQTDVSIPPLSFEITAEDFAAFAAQVTGETPSVTIEQYFEALQAGVFMVEEEEGGGLGGGGGEGGPL